jgi:hypothetical protein
MLWSIDGLIPKEMPGYCRLAQKVRSTVDQRSSEMKGSVTANCIVQSKRPPDRGLNGYKCQNLGVI